MKRYLLVGVLVVLVLVVALAPVSLLRPVLPPPGAPAELAQLRGSLWRASGALVVQGQRLATVRWAFSPSALLKGQLGFGYQLDGEGLAVRGQAARAISSWHLTAEGTVSTALFAAELAAYELTVPGTLTLDEVSAAAAGTRVTSLDGAIRWGGGPVTYPQGDRLATVVLPPMRAELALDSAEQPAAEIYEATATGARSASVNYPLLTLTALNSGFVKTALTRRLTRLAGVPWPGSEPDHAVVLEVEQQVF